MKTDDLISAIAQDCATRGPSLAARMGLALGAGGAVALGLFALTLGVRPDIALALQTWRFLAKLAVVTTCFLAALWAVARLSRPDASLRDVGAALLIAPALLMVSTALELTAVAPGLWPENAIGTNARTCMLAIPMLALAPLAALLASLQAGAPRSPSAAGAAAGLLAGALAATIYATHCPDDSPLFVAVWYTLAVAVVTMAGAAAGSRFLRW